MTTTRYTIFRLNGYGEVNGWLHVNQKVHYWVREQKDATPFKSSRRAYATARELNRQVSPTAGCAYGVQSVKWEVGK